MHFTKADHFTLCIQDVQGKWSMCQFHYHSMNYHNIYLELQCYIMRIGVIYLKKIMSKLTKIIYIQGQITIYQLARKHIVIRLWLTVLFVNLSFTHPYLAKLVHNSIINSENPNSSAVQFSVIGGQSTCSLATSLSSKNGNPNMQVISAPW